jgi:hypothetical protein
MTLLELAQYAGIQPKLVACTGGGEYHSSCPDCGGRDRFYIQPNRQMNKCLGFYCCRQCGTSGDSIQFARQFLKYTFQEAAHAVNAPITEYNRFSALQKSYNAQTVVLKSPPELWIKNATAFIEEAHKRLLTMPNILGVLSSRGLPLDAVHQYKFGWSHKNEYLKRRRWGLDEELGSDGRVGSLQDLRN